MYFSSSCVVLYILEHSLTTRKAGLFCAVLAALLIESYKLLIPSSDDRSLVLLENILITLHNKTAPQLPIRQDFTPQPFAIRVNTLWFASLALALGVAVEVMLAKQWLHKYGEGKRKPPMLFAHRHQVSQTYLGSERSCDSTDTIIYVDGLYRRWSTFSRHSFILPSRSSSLASSISSGTSTSSSRPSRSPFARCLEAYILSS